jgi:site-specific DNA-cytosine methylase
MRWFVKSRRAQSTDDYETWKQGGVSPTLNAFDNGNDTRATVLVLAYDPGTIGPLTSSGMSRARGTETVESNHVLVFTAQRVGEAPRIYENISPALLSRMGTGGNNTPMIANIPDTSITWWDGSDIAPALTRNSENQRMPDKNQLSAVVETNQQTAIVRRLTPIECERLMGWPDNHTLHRADGKTNSDSTRYKMCGNGVASPVAHWIAYHLEYIL